MPLHNGAPAFVVMVNLNRTIVQRCDLIPQSVNLLAVHVSQLLPEDQYCKTYLGRNQDALWY